MLEIKELSVSYGSKEVLRSVSLSLGKADALGIVGLSGAGKTTLLRSIVRLLPGEAEVTGRIMLDGTNLLALNEQEAHALRGARIGLLPQNPLSALNPMQRLHQSIGEGARHHRRLGRREAKNEVEQLLRTVGLNTGLAHAYPYQLSGGMRTRAALAALLACGAKILLLDEPTTGLDLCSQTDLLELLRRIRDEAEISLLLVTHELPMALELCSRIAIMEAGRVVEEVCWTRGEIFSSELGRHLHEATPRLSRRGR